MISTYVPNVEKCYLGGTPRLISSALLFVNHSAWRRHLGLPTDLHWLCASQGRTTSKQLKFVEYRYSVLSRFSVVRLARAPGMGCSDISSKGGDPLGFVLAWTPQWERLRRLALQGKGSCERPSLQRWCHNDLQ